jgi:EmrB/QacA subfamily drug resistance transporter
VPESEGSIRRRTVVLPAMIPDRILLPLIVASALFMETLDATVLSTALPVIAAEFGASPIHLKLALTSYLLSLAVFIPASAWIADKFGVRLVFRAALIVFTLASIACGLSNSIEELVAARVVQGIGGAMMVPVGRLVILRSVKKSELVGALAWFTVPALIGPVLGPPLGGFITTYFDWRWIFWINVPVGIAGVVLATIFFPDIRGERNQRFDARGFFLVGAGLATFVTGSTTIGLDVLPAGLVVALLAVGILLLSGYVVHSGRSENPILDLKLLRLDTFRASIAGGLLFRIGVGAVPFLLPLMLQLTFGMTAFESGVVTFVIAIGAIAMKFVAEPILRRFGFRKVLVGSAVIAGALTAAPAAFTLNTPVAVMVAVLLVSGFVRSLQFTSLNSIAFDEVPPDRVSRASAMTSVAQQLALSIGISIGAISLAATSGGGDIVRGDFVVPFILIGLIGAASALVYWRLPAHAGEEISGHGRKVLTETDVVEVPNRPSGP